MNVTVIGWVTVAEDTAIMLRCEQITGPGTAEEASLVAISVSSLVPAAP